MMNKHLIVISVDAMVYEDLEFARELPGFKRILEKSAIIKRVRTIYPSLTHPVHATIITGSRADKTGVVNNLYFDRSDPENPSGAWYNNLADIKCDTLIHAAKRAGLTVAAASWPLTSYPDGLIDYLLPNALNYYFDMSDDTPLDVFRRLGASPEMLGIIEEGIKLHGYRDEHPSVDRLQAFCATEIIKRYKPNLLLMHPSYVDSMRHKYGVFSDAVKEALMATDGWISMLIAATEEAGIYDETDFVILSDHGQINVTRTAQLNVLLKRAGFISTDPDGRITSYDAFVNKAGASAQVYLPTKDDAELESRVYRFFNGLVGDAAYGFERIYTAREAKELYGLEGDFSFVLEGDGFTAFTNALEGPVFKRYDAGNYSTARGAHGHLPDKGPQPIFIGSGPHFNAGISLEYGDIINHAPTMAAILGIDLIDPDGRAVDELIRLP